MSTGSPFPLWRVSFAGPTVDDDSFDALATAGFPLEAADRLARANELLYDVVGRAADEESALTAVRVALGDEAPRYTHFRALKVEPQRRR